MATLYLMVGCPGSGKSTYLEKYATEGQIVSRDSIRFGLLEDGDEYFKYETEVFDAFIDFIQSYLDRDINVYADATHLNEKSRLKVLNNLTLNNHKVIPIVFNYPLDICLERNKKRAGRARVPDSVVVNMYHSYRDPAHDNFEYEEIVYIKGGK